ncbi:hypothetical protein [Oceanobacter antarcticus]|uniref:Uncharacterized protein n=1 Tax=Oceanobacter antarcticus TaxID=3133425 RepID=A0ABW8NEV7_9GAMM
MKFSIKSRKIQQILTFSRPGNGYIFVDINSREGTLGSQICHGGRFMGSTITYFGDDQAEFEKICRNWYRKFLAENGEMYADYNEFGS